MEASERAAALRAGTETQRAGARDPWRLSRLTHVLVVLIPPVCLTGAYLAASRGGAFAFDFEHAYRWAGRQVLLGQSPFPPVTRAALVTNTAFVYPPFAAVFMIPFALLPSTLGGAVFMVLLAASAMASLYLVGVRDWRCFVAIFLWRPVLLGLQTANLTLLLGLGCAIVWRYRGRALLAGVVAGTLIALKLVLFPLLIWFLATRRYAAAASATAAAVVLTLGSWALIGFAGFRDFIPMMRLLSDINEKKGFSPLVLALKFGAGIEPARALAVLVGLASLAAVVHVARRRQDHVGAFVLALVASLLVSPIVWLHYYALLSVALGILRPRYGWIWVLPLTVVLAPVQPPGPSWWTVPVLATFALLITLPLLQRETAAGTPLAPARPRPGIPRPLVLSADPQMSPQRGGGFVSNSST